MARTSRYKIRRSLRTTMVGVAILLGAILSPRFSDAMVRLDFNQKFFLHPGHQVWDFSMVRPDSTYHIFYHTILETTPSAVYGDTIWHATSPDLKRWTIHGPVITVGPNSWEAGATWAPDVFRDEDNQRWAMAYTACDPLMNQRIAFAFSPDLYAWTKEPTNPVIVPDSTQYVWSIPRTWSDFRDPYVWNDQGTWNIIVTAKKYYSGPTGVLYHATSTDLLHWTDVGVMFRNDGPDPWRVLESPQYKVLGDFHDLLFGEFDTGAISLVSNTDPAGWTMADRVMLEYGSYAPEVNEFDPGTLMYARITPFTLAKSSDLGYCVRMDTLLTNPDGSDPQVYKPHPLAENWATYTGLSVTCNPTFGDNPLWRGEPSVGVVGNGYFSSQEYFQGPLSGHGAPGISLGDPAVGSLDSKPFVITGNRMDLLVGGGDYPQTCYVALLTAADSTILCKTTGQNSEYMTPRSWDLRPYVGMECFVRIVDAESGLMGHINVDEIIESQSDWAAVPPVAATSIVTRHQANPNPFNPVTTIAFDLAEPSSVRLLMLDLRGHTVWSSPVQSGVKGTNQITWRGRNQAGEPVAAGTYLYIIEAQGSAAATGKACLVK